MSAKTNDLVRFDSRVALLLKWMIEGSESIVPSVKEGRVTYPDVTKLMPVGNSAEVLDSLLAQGLLIKEYYTSEILCPSCGSSSLKDKYTCVSCHRSHIETGDMIEHYSCGNVDFEAKFDKDGKLLCPKCRKELKVIGTDYRRVGKLFRCNDCGKASSIPGVAHVCQNCGTVSTPENAQLRILHEYRINEKRRKKIESIAGIYGPLVELLEKKGFKIESPAFLKGESGIEHPFDIAAEVGGKYTLFDIRTHDESVSETEIMGFFAKVTDVAHREAILIAVPRASEYARRLSRPYNITLVEGDNINEVLASIAARYMERPVASPSYREASAKMEDPSQDEKWGEIVEPEEETQPIE